MKKNARKLTVETTTLKLLSANQLSVAQGGIPPTRWACDTRYCPPTLSC